MLSGRVTTEFGRANANGKPISVKQSKDHRWQSSRRRLELRLGLSCQS